MPIDAEAYMAGALPGLSRGASWVTEGAADGYECQMMVAGLSSGHQTSSASGYGVGSHHLRTHSNIPSAHSHGHTHVNPLIGAPATSPVAMMFDPLILGQMAAYGSSMRSHSGLGQGTPGYRAHTLARGAKSPLAGSEGGDYFSQNHHNAVGSHHAPPSPRTPEDHMRGLRYGGWSRGAPSALGSPREQSGPRLRLPSQSAVKARRSQADSRHLQLQPTGGPAPRPIGPMAESLPALSPDPGYSAARSRGYRSHPVPAPARPSALREQWHSRSADKVVGPANIPKGQERLTRAGPRSVSRDTLSLAELEDALPERVPYAASPIGRGRGSHSTGPLSPLSVGLGTPRDRLCGQTMMVSSPRREAPWGRQSSGSRPPSDSPPTHALVTPDHVYRHIGFAEPTRELQWNRDGPAMRTHGVAWHRDIPEELPHGPAGPLLVQARPPRPAWA